MPPDPDAAAPASGRRIAFSTTSLTGSTIVIALLGVVVLRLLTQHLGQSSYGIVVTALSIVTTVMAVTDLGVSSTIGRDLARDRAQASSVLGAALGLRLAISLLALPLVALFAAVAYHGHPAQLRWAIVAIALAIPFDALRAVLSGLFVARVENHILALVNLAQQAAFVGFVAAAVLLGGGVLWVCAAYVGSQALAAALLAIAAARRVPLRLRLDPRGWRSQLAVSSSIGVVRIVNIVYLRADSVLLSLLQPLHAVALYGVAYAITSFLVGVPDAYAQSLLPSFTTTDDAKLDPLLRQATATAVTIGSLLAAGTWCVGPGVITLLAGPSYAGAGRPLQILAISVVLTALTSIFGFATFSRGAHRPLVWVGLATLALNVGVNLLVIPRFGVVGAASVVVASEAVMALGTWIVLRRATELRLPVLRLCSRPVLAALVTVGLLRGVFGLVPQHLGAIALVGLAVVGCYAVVLAATGGGRILRRR